MISLETLQKFCHSYSKYQSPFNNRGYTYATDGFVLVRVKGNMSDVEYSKEDYPEGLVDEQFSGPFEGKYNLSEFRTEVQKEKCDVCGGTGLLTECPECQGSGKLELDSGYNYYSVECQTCYGTGYLEDGEGAEQCDNCSGTGEVEVRTLVKIGSQSFDNRLINKILDNLPGNITLETSTSVSKGAMFSFEGGEGLIMPVRTNGY